MGLSIGLPKLPPMKEKASRRNNTPLWCVSSPMNQSVTGACGGHKGVETRIGVAVDADTPVVARDLAHQKVDRIVGVARLVDLFGRMLIGDERTEIDVFPLAHVASPHILENEDIALLQIEFQK